MVVRHLGHESFRRLEYLLQSVHNLIDFWRQIVTTPNPGEENLGFDEIVERYYRQIGVPAADREATVAIAKAALSHLD